MPGDAGVARHEASFMQNRELQTEAVGEEKQTEQPLNGSTHNGLQAF